jgi:hypothetical protein
LKTKFAVQSVPDKFEEEEEIMLEQQHIEMCLAKIQTVNDQLNQLI